MKKRLLAFIVVITVICSSFGFSAIADDALENVTAEEIYATEEFDICVALGIFTDSVKPGDAVTRGALAQSSARLLNLQDIVPTGSDFEDVSQSSPYYNAIGMVSKSDIMLGDGTGKFRPNDNAKLADVATVLVRTIGYDVVAQSKGGYPTGYLGQAGVLGILEDVSVQDELNFNEFAKIIVNTFEVEILSLEILPGNGTYKLTDSTVLDLMNITEIEGVVKKNDITGLYPTDKPCNPGYVLIDDTLVLNGDTGLENMLGHTVVVYAEDSTKDYERIAYYAADDDAEDMLIDFDDVDTSYNFFQKNDIKYYDADGRLKSEKIESGFAVIYNGVASNFRTMELIENNEGTLRIIDSDSNSKADVLIIEAYQDYVVDSVYLEQNIIVEKTGKQFDFDDLFGENSVEIVDNEGNTKTMSDLYEWSVLSVYDSYIEGKANSGYRFVKIVVSDDCLDGTLDSIADRNGNKEITIDGIEYMVSEFYPKSSSVHSIELGLKGTFCLNAFNKICAYKVDELEKLYTKYGVLVDAHIGEGFDTSVSYKIYSQDGEWIMPLAAKNVMFDGERKKEEARYNCLLENGTVKRQIIRYKLDDNGELYYIDTPTVGSNEENDSLHLLYTVDDPPMYYRSGPGSFGRILNKTPFTVTFSIPTDPEKEDEYGLLISYNEGTKLAVEGYYDTTPFEASCIVMYDVAASAIELSQARLVGKITRTLHNDEEVYKLTTYGPGGEKVIFAELDATGIEDVACGDVIAYSTNGLGIINNVQMVYDLSERKVEVADSGFFSEHRVFSGWIYKKYNNKFSLSFDEVTNDTKNKALETFDLEKYSSSYTYHITTETVSKAKGTDLFDYDTFNTSYSFVVGTDYTDHPRALFIYIE